MRRLLRRAPIAVGVAMEFAIFYGLLLLLTLYGIALVRG